MGLQKVDVAYNPNYIVSLAVDSQGVVWAGTWGGGLSRFDGKTWTQYTVAEGLPGNHVFMLHIDPKGVMWIGTNNGLARGRMAVRGDDHAATACSTTPCSRWPPARDGTLVGRQLRRRGAHQAPLTTAARRATAPGWRVNSHCA
jgi:hypothetical protein